VILCDTGPLVAAADRSAADNRPCTDMFTSLHLAGRPILVPAPVVAEVGYLLGRAGGAKVESAFLRSIAQQTIRIVDLEIPDYERMAESVDTYADFRSARPMPLSSQSPSDSELTRWQRSTTGTSGPSALATSRRSHCCPDAVRPHRSPRQALRPRSGSTGAAQRFKSVRCFQFPPIADARRGYPLGSRPCQISIPSCEN
jgi:predicted nucleic acid-binding protein